MCNHLLMHAGTNSDDESSGYCPGALPSEAMPEGDGKQNLTLWADDHISLLHVDSIRRDRCRT